LFQFEKVLPTELPGAEFPSDLNSQQTSQCGCTTTSDLPIVIAALTPSPLSGSSSRSHILFSLLRMDQGSAPVAIGLRISPTGTAGVSTTDCHRRGATERITQCAQKKMQSP
jgi:hypothetical protein